MFKERAVRTVLSHVEDDEMIAFLSVYGYESIANEIKCLYDSMQTYGIQSMEEVTLTVDSKKSNVLKDRLLENIQEMLKRAPSNKQTFKDNKIELLRELK
ncbi:hypothetical protein ACFL3D_05720, partial [Candidatus Omnitrophota bacterium]